MDFLIGYYEHFGYIGIFIVLFLCGLGLPLPEDITLIASGYLVYTGGLGFYRTLIVCFLGVIAGDLTIYSIGRHWGYMLLEHRFFRNFITKDRIAIVENYFNKYGGKTIFFVRFLPGLRATAYWTAGLFNYGTAKFLLLDGLAALISVPAIIYLTYYFGGEIDQTIALVKKAKYGVYLVLGIVVLFFIIKWRISKRKGVKESYDNTKTE